MEFAKQLSEFISVISKVKKPIGKTEEEHSKEVLETIEKTKGLEKEKDSIENEIGFLVDKLKILKSKKKRIEEKIYELKKVLY